jgi:hypothetical protein
MHTDAETNYIDTTPGDAGAFPLISRPRELARLLRAALAMRRHPDHHAGADAAVFNIPNGDVGALKSAITTANSNGQPTSSTSPQTAPTRSRLSTT